MAVKSNSFQEKFELTQKTEKISSVADPINAREGAPFTENTAGAFPHEIMDEKIKDAEKRRAGEGTGSQNPPLRRAGGWLLEERDGSSASDRDCRSRSVSTTTRSRSRSSSSSVSSGSSYSSGRHGDRRRNRRRSYYHSSSSSRSPPRRYRARSRSYSPSYSPIRRHRLRSPSRSRSRSRSGGRRVYGFVGRSRFRLTFSPERRSRTRSRSRSRSPDRTSIRLSLQEKRQLLLIARENAARALGVEEVALPASVNAVLEVQEGPRSGIG
ncbi:hypothetical protein ANANG_G00003940 [Anguilla anguilla]|uniref:Arginine/serine-rich protein 1 n=1 Tax=Anguilla anguilla TaxID=7936 RepID=A0A9D3S905_ANGAN|nr:hypothetical protein ANANG_G00003940 [Anguilla anguilla]